MISDFLGDYNNHLRMRMLVEAGRPLQSEYQNALARHQDGQHSMCVWQAERSLLRAANVYGLMVIYVFCLCWKHMIAPNAFTKGC